MREKIKFDVTPEQAAEDMRLYDEQKAYDRLCVIMVSGLVVCTIGLVAGVMSYLGGGL